MMHCGKCNSNWNTNKPVSVCPFCGASLADEGSGGPNIYDNSKDALAHIMRVHGADVLLGSTLKNYFTDYAPGVEGARKHVIVSMSASGAAAILQRKIAASTVEQENAFRQAVQRVVDAYGTERSLVEGIVLEFTDALGWRINVQERTQRKPPQSQPVQPKPFKLLQSRQEPPKRQPQDQQISPRPPKNQQTQLKPSQLPPKPAAQPTPQKAAESLTVGQRNVRFGKYSWRVLDVQNGRALLLTEDVIEERRYHSSMEGITWEGCDLRRYLNGEFLQTFGSSERSRIASAVNTTPDNPCYGTPGGRNTTDTVFLLSIDEVAKYFGGSGNLQTRKGYYIDDRYNDERIAKYRNEKAWWWLRSPGSHGNCAAVVRSSGCFNIDGSDIDYSLGGVRPALWLNLDWKIDVQPQKNVRFGKYNWRVLDVQNGKALLLIEDFMEERCYTVHEGRITWEECDLRRYLNGEFLQTFSSTEQSLIASTVNANPNNANYGTPGGRSTTDKVFLLSINEVVNYFGKGSERWIDDQYNKVRMAKYGNKKIWWWLRSPGYDVGAAAGIDSGGHLDIAGSRVNYSGGIVRPALWLNL